MNDPWRAVTRTHTSTDLGMLWVVSATVYIDIQDFRVQC